MKGLFPFFAPQVLEEPPPPPLALKVPKKYHDVATSQLEAEVTSGRNTVDIPLTTP